MASGCYSVFEVSMSVTFSLFISYLLSINWTELSDLSLPVGGHSVGGVSPDSRRLRFMAT